jgi:hypothetical protein
MGPTTSRPTNSAFQSDSSTPPYRPMAAVRSRCNLRASSAVWTLPLDVHSVDAESSARQTGLKRIQSQGRRHQDGPPFSNDRRSCVTSRDGLAPLGIACRNTGAAGSEGPIKCSRALWTRAKRAELPANEARSGEPLSNTAMRMQSRIYCGSGECCDRRGSECHPQAISG